MTAESWADDDTLPPRSETTPDAEGIKTIVEYKLEKGKKVKITTVVQEVFEKVFKSALARRSWEKFGNGLNEKDNSNVTYISNEEVSVEDPNADMVQPGEKKEGDSIFSGVKNSSIVICRHCGMTGDHWTLKCPYKDTPIDELAAAIEADKEGKSTEDGSSSTAAPATGLGSLFGGGGGNKYVPPGQRGGASVAEASGSSDRDHATLRVTNISTETRDGDLQELFKAFGQISRIYLAKDRETFASRGFAFVSFHFREDAERAMQALNGFGYDHLILKIEWAKPSVAPTANQDASGNLNTTFRSGYGKALPQTMASAPRK